MSSSNVRTATEIISDAWKVLKTEGDSASIPGLQSSMMLTVLDKANREYLRTFRRSGGDPKALEAETGYDLITDTALAADVASGATSFTVDDSSDGESAGAFVIWDDNTADFGTYTGNAANALSGVSGIQFAHEEDDTVQFLYALPSDFGSLRKEGDNGDGVTINGLPYFYTEGEPQGFYFSIRGDYLWFPRGVSGSAFLKYNAEATTIDADDDSVQVPEDYDFFLVYRLVEHGRRVRGDNADKVIEAKVEADKILRQAMIEQQHSRGVRVRPIARRVVNFDSRLYPNV